MQILRAICPVIRRPAYKRKRARVCMPLLPTRGLKFVPIVLAPRSWSSSLLHSIVPVSYIHFPCRQHAYSRPQTSKSWPWSPSLSPGSAAVFDPAEYSSLPFYGIAPPETTFDSLRKRMCLPSSFNASDFESVIQKCGRGMTMHAMSVRDEEWPGCVDVRLRLPLVFNCAADR